ncbi:MAG: hypothetical protein HGJ94_00790 [Desulfosarcina sp.]|nr:hypothetical protein [Desulfosarcina sp.]MBC2744806.1 hypothetical protein [Desulfosarcina sp.]MBC2767714.1 hypothetical protein [Desulfosarcina sp.]
MANINPEPGPSTESDFPYFRHLWNNVVVALLAASFLPLIAIGGGMYYYSTSVLKDKTLASLRSEVDSHQKTVDQFLFERIMDLKAISQMQNPVSLTSPGKLEAVFKAIQPAPDSRYFTDLGIIDQYGAHMAYVGPYDLMAKNYSHAQWFKAVMASGVYVSDVFSGFRQVPHFIIAVKRTENGEPWIIRATMDAVYFENLVSKITAGSGGDAFLVNKKGLLQTTPLRAGGLMEPSDIQDPERFDGIRMEETDGKIRVMAWLKGVPWLSVVEMDRDEIYSRLQRVRNVGIFIFLMGAVFIGFTVLLTTNHLVSRLEIKRRNIQLMGHHLRQANKMTLSLQLYKGFFQEINEALVNIDSSAAWIGEQNRKARSLEGSRDEVDENLQQIRDEILRSRETIHQLTSFSLPTAPAVADVDINGMLDRLSELFRRETYYNNIQIHQDFQEPLPSIRNDPSQLQQVFQNLIFNAIDAVEKDGVITLKTKAHGDSVHVIIKDDGPGIAPDIMERIFDPLFTTDYRCLGLGLAICRDILKQMGGEIEVATRPGKGVSFTVTLPVHFQSPSSAKP